jgi:RTX calcium-binding nonapeptide repeat (4 copies)
LLLGTAIVLVGASSVWAARIVGTPGNDTLRGGAHADTIYGKAGNDRLFGGAGNDNLVGGLGNDRLVGGVGADVLRCGPGRDSAVRDRADKVVTDCEIVTGPGPAPAPPPPPPPQPPAAPGAPATYEFGPEVTPSQQGAVRDALDLGARYYHTALGRDVPPFQVWAYTDAETLARLFAEKSGEARSVEDARNLWASLIAHAGTSGLWVGPQWFSQQSANGKKILAKEEFMILLYGIAGSNSLNSGQDDIPRAGPRWLSEGTGELAAYLAVSSAGLASMSAVRADWAQRAKSSPVPLQRLAILRGQFEAGSNAWGIMALAVERLVGEGGLAKMLSFYEAVGRGEAWDRAFATVFGKSLDAFYLEFAAYRQGL